MIKDNSDNVAVGDVSCYPQHWGLSDQQLHESERTNCALAGGRTVR